MALITVAKVRSSGFLWRSFLELGLSLGPKQGASRREVGFLRGLWVIKSHSCPEVLLNLQHGQ